MTVCVAAITQNMVIGASDQMLTAGDVQFEPIRSKIIPLTTSIVVMTAGDSSLQTEILSHVASVVNQRIAEKPDEWWKVGEVAELYGQYAAGARLKRAEDSILAPLGLDHETFLSRQNEFSAGFVKDITTELFNFRAPAVESIVCGVDLAGPHIYVAEDHNITCRDSIGFAAIGAGYWHANSQFMFAGHTRDRPIPETLLLAYSAKKRAEVAPGVGERTDMFGIGPQLGTFSTLIPDVIDRLGSIYRDTQQRMRRAEKRGEEKVNAYVQEVIAAAQRRQPGQQEASGADGSSAAVEQTGDGSGASQEK